MKSSFVLSKVSLDSTPTSFAKLLTIFQSQEMLLSHRHIMEPSRPIAIPVPAMPNGTQAQAPPFVPSQPLMMPFPPSQSSQHSGLVPTLFPPSQSLSQSLPPPGFPMQLAAPGAALPVVPTTPSDQFSVGPAAPLLASAPIMNYRSRLPSRAHNSPLAALPASLPVPVTPSFAGVQSLGAGVASQTTHQRRMASSASTRASAPHGRQDGRPDASKKEAKTGVCPKPTASAPSCEPSVAQADAANAHPKAFTRTFEDPRVGREKGAV
jgi:hypothetical protein